MGLAASQARLLFITARKSDIEGQSMKIANQKMILARQTQALSEEYSTGINQTKLTWSLDGSSVGTNTADLTYNLLMSPNATNTANQYLIGDGQGRTVLSDYYMTKLGLSGSSGATIDMTRNDFLSKFGLDGTKFAEPTYTETDDNSVDTGGVADEVANLISNLSNIGQGSSSILETNYNSMKESFESIIESTGDVLKSLGYNLSDKDWINGGDAIKVVKDSGGWLSDLFTGWASTVTLGLIDGNGGDYKAGGKNNGYVSGTCNDSEVDPKQIDYVMDMYNTARASLELLNFTKSHNNTNEAKACLAAIKGLISGQQVSGSAGSIGGTYHSGQPGYHSASQDVAAGLIDAVAKSTGNTAPGRSSLYLGNMADLVELLSKSTAGSSTTPTPSTDQDKADYYTNLYNAIKANGWTADSQVNNTEYLQEQLEGSNYFIMKMNSNGSWGFLSTGDPTSPVRTETDADAVAMSQAEYEAEKDKLEAKEQTLDIKLKQLDTERAALDTEYDTVKSVIQKNIERSFKMFSA